MRSLLFASKSHPLGGFHLAEQSAGAVLVGRTADTVRPFPSARVAYDHHRALADEGVHWAWNVCYLLEELVEREDGDREPGR